MSNNINNENIIGGGDISNSPYLLICIFILAIITFFFFYFTKNAKPNGLLLVDSHQKGGGELEPPFSPSTIQIGLIKIKEWLIEEINKFFAYLHVEGETIKKVIT
jgi:hypothetical protein